MSLREKVADELAYNDDCGPGPMTREEYLADADVILKVIGYNELREQADKLAASLRAMVESYDSMPALGAQQTLYEYERAMTASTPKRSSEQSANAPDTPPLGETPERGD